MALNENDPGYWRNAGRHMTVFGIPVLLYSLFLFWFRFPSWTTIYVVCGVLAGFRLLAAFHWTHVVLLSRLVYLVRGKQLSGRPWWYRRFTEKD